MQRQVLGALLRPTYTYFMQHAHLIGARGAEMQALAAVLAGRGWRLTGSDVQGGVLPPSNGGPVPVFRSHHPQNVPLDTDLVVYSDTVGAENRALGRRCLVFRACTAARPFHGKRVAITAGHRAGLPAGASFARKHIWPVPRSRR